MASDISLSQFHGVFFEECSEGIEIMEKELLNLEPGSSDLDVINNIFRAAHSIKGGAGTFGFAEISEFTHGMETILDNMRDGRQEVSNEAIALLLSSVDGLRIMVESSKAGKEYDIELIDRLKQQLEQFTQQATVASEPSEAEVLPDTNSQGSSDYQSDTITWHISFYPHDDLFFSGNDPLRLIRELNNLGELEIQLNKSRLPPLTDLIAEKCYLGWDMVLHSNVSRNDIEEVFAWVEDDCEVHIDIEHERRKAEGRRESDVKDTDERRRGEKAAKSSQATASIRVGIDKVDALVNLVGELVITQSILSRVCNDLNPASREKLTESMEMLERHTRDLQEQAMSIRMLPVDFAFQRLPRIVHDLSRNMGKQVKLQFSGESTELDKTVLEKIGDPLVHLVRNALDHGIEMPEARIAAGKEEAGLVSVTAYHQGGNIVVEISDDGAGLDTKKIYNKAVEKGLIDNNEELTETQIYNLIFQPGFSTAEHISDISGRGVGMDVVKRNINDLGGSVEVYSQLGAGSVFTIRLPLTLAILDGQLIRIGTHIYIVPLLSIVESLQINNEQLSMVAGKSELYHYRDEYIPVIRLEKVFDIAKQHEDMERELLVVIDIGRKRVGILVDEVVGQQQVVIKSLDENYKHVQGLAGATVLGDGSVALILDVLGLSKQFLNHDMISRDFSRHDELH